LAGRGQVSWLPGSLPLLPGAPVGLQWNFATAQRPVTVAGPRRFLTGLPLTHRPYVERDPSAGATGTGTQKKRGGPKAASLEHQKEESYFFFFFFFFFFCLQRCVASAVCVVPPAL
jgi:hypothetical protein